MTTLFLVVPCYNEQEVFEDTLRRLTLKYDSLIKGARISENSRFLFVNDGSKDQTYPLMEKAFKENKYTCVLNLSRNRGHQNALLAGLLYAKDFCDCAISLDADLQDDIEAIDQMLSLFEEGNEIVYGVRSDRSTDSFFKRNSAKLFYKFTKLLGGELIYNHADFRLMSKRAIEALENFKETNLFLRGIVPILGFKSQKVYYKRQERTLGKSKYPLKKMLSFATEGITSLSIRPVEFIYKLGLLVALFGGGVLIYALVRHLTGNTLEGWTSLMGSLWLLGGLQLFAIGVVGKYVGKTYIEAKARPRFIIEDFLRK